MEGPAASAAEAVRAAAAASLLAPGGQPGFLQKFIAIDSQSRAARRFFSWNEIALATAGNDHWLARIANQPCSVIRYEQLGPHRSSRAMAMVHLAMFEAVNYVLPTAESFASFNVAVAPRGSFALGPDGVDGLTVAELNARERILDMAIAWAAYDVLAALYPSQRSDLLSRRQLNLRGVELGPNAAIGQAIGQAAAAAILSERTGDGANTANGEGSPKVEAVLLPGDCDAAAPPFPIGTGEFDWKQDPVSRLNVALGSTWGSVRPFHAQTMPTDVFLPAPATADPRFEAQLDEVKRLGSSAEGAQRTPTEAFKADFWAYDGVPQLCAPPALYNQVVTAVLREDDRRHDVTYVARLYALANMAMADTGIAAWHDKWTHGLARPVTVLRARDGASDSPACSGPGCVMACSGSATGSAWCPLGAPATNGRGPNFTPPFPAYPSGHAAFGGALFEVLREVVGDRGFTMVSAEFDGTNFAAGEQDPRPERPQSWGSFAEAEAENARSRIWLGIHYQLDADAGVAQGNCVARKVLGSKLRVIDPATGMPAPTPAHLSAACAYGDLLAVSTPVPAPVAMSTGGTAPAK